MFGVFCVHEPGEFFESEGFSTADKIWLMTEAERRIMNEIYEKQKSKSVTPPSL